MDKNALIIFSRFPQLGKVKKRLAHSLGDEKTLKFYDLCAKSLFNEASKLGENSSVFLFYSDKNDKNRIRNWVNKDFFYLHQNGSNLGLRMLSAFQEVFRRNFKKVIIVGTDIPDINANLINSAFNFLDKFDVVIGPSNDGGYYLLGMNKLDTELFYGIKWSTHEVYSKTLVKLLELSLNVKVLPKLIDVDTEEDLKKWLKSENSTYNYYYTEIKKLIGKK